MSSPSAPRRSFSRGDRSGSMSGARHGLQSLTMSSGNAPGSNQHIVGSPTSTSGGRRSTGGTSMRRPSIGFDRLGSMSCVVPLHRISREFYVYLILTQTFSCVEWHPCLKVGAPSCFLLLSLASICKNFLGHFA